MPTLPELVNLRAARGMSLLAAFAVGATTEDLARRTVAGLWESLRGVAPLHVFATVRTGPEGGLRLTGGRWEDLQRSPAGLDVVVRAEGVEAPSLVALARVDALVVYAADPAASDTKGEGR